MLLYSMLHLAGVRGVDGEGHVVDEPAVSLDDMRNFRQLHSPCAGHPEYGEAAGIEMTTGPLGQGAATSVGMAMAAQWLAARYDRPGFELFGYRVYALCSDGDLMEGIACEAASLAGHLQALQPVLDLRRQLHHDRRQDRPGVQRGRGAAF